MSEDPILKKLDEILNACDDGGYRIVLGSSREAMRIKLRELLAEVAIDAVGSLPAHLDLDFQAIVGDIRVRFGLAPKEGTT